MIKTTVFFFKSTSKHEKQYKGTGTGRQFVLTARKKTIERTGTGRQYPPSLASLSATNIWSSLIVNNDVTSHQAFSQITSFCSSQVYIASIRKYVLSFGKHL